MKKWLCILLSLFVYVNAWANIDSLSVAERNAQQGFNDTIDRMAEDFVTVSLVIAEPGEVLYSAFGHAMLHLRCPSFNLDYVFSYESEPIEDNWGRFLRGDLKMGMFAIPIDTMLEPYRKEGRGVVEYELYLGPEQKQELWRLMDELVAKGPDQPYDYYNRGCAISVVNVVKEALNGQQIEYAPWPNEFEGTLRELGYSCVTQSGYLWNRFVLMTLAGSDIDNPRIAKEKKLIVPADLVAVWQNATIDGHPLLSSEPRVVVASKRQANSSWCTPLLISILLFVLALFSLGSLWIKNSLAYVGGQVVDYTVLTVVTIIGLVIFYTVFVSTLPCTKWNWLIIPFNIFPAVFWYWRKYWALPLACILLVWCCVMAGQFVWGHILVDRPHILLTIAFSVVLVKQSRISSNKYRK